MKSVQFIEHNGRREFAILPIELFNRVAATLEDMDDVALLDAARARDDGFRIPGAAARALLAGENPLKVWREARGLTQAALAKKAGASKAFVCQIETGQRTGSVSTLRALARALNVKIDDLQSP